MRALWVLTLTIFAIACGKTDTPDAGSTDAGSTDAGFDAGFVEPPVCLPDGFDAGTASDAGLDFSCRGRAPQPGGQPELIVSGKTTKAGFVRTALAGVQVDLVLFDGTVLSTTTSDDAGAYRLTFDAGCFPVAAEVRATHPPDDAGFAVGYAAPLEPFRFDRAGFELVLFDASTQGLASAIAGVTLTPGTAALAMNVQDCEGNPVEGAVVTTASGLGDVRYVGASGLPTMTLSATGPSGDVVIFNLPGTSVDVSATLDAGVIAQRVVTIHPDGSTGTFLGP